MNLLSLLLLLVYGGSVVSIFRPNGWTKAILIGYVFIALGIIETGYLISYLNRFSDINSWTYVFLGLLVFAILINYFISPKLSLPALHLAGFWQKRSFFEKSLLSMLSIGVVTILGLCLVEVLFTAPQNTDALTYHLARVGYYLQHGTMEWYPANQWPQVVHPKNSSCLFAYIFLVSGVQENLTQWPQYLAYGMVIMSVYGICRQLFLSQYTSICSALISSLPICLILGSMTNQNDLLITSFAGCAVYFMLCFKNEGHKKYLLLFAISTAIMTGFKASALMVYPVLGVVVIFTFYENFSKGRIKAFLLLVLFSIGTFIIITLPAGYWENWIIYGNPIGPEHMRKEHNFEGLPLGQVVYEGWKNVFRYLANFYCFDGFLNGPHWIYGANSALWKGITWIFQSVWPDIYSQEFVRLPFGTLKKISADEEKVFFGPIGFLLLIPGIGWGIFHGIRNWKQSMKAPVVGFLSVCCLVFICSQSFFGQFDPWRGRMFGTLVLFAAPLIGCGLEKFSRSNLFNSYVLLVIVFSCWAGIWSILFRYESSWVRPNYTQKTLFQMTRMEQLMRDLPDQYAPYAKFDQLVPQHATVISWLQGSYPEYVLFGEKLTRKVYTLAEARDKKITADVIIFDQVLIRPIATDVALGNGLFLRKLNL